MATNRPNLVIDGPFAGLALDESEAQPTNDVISRNIDYSQGRKQGRQGFTTVNETCGKWAEIGVHDYGDGSRFILTVGLDPGDGQPVFIAYDEWGNIAFDPIELGAYGEPVDILPACSFASWTIPGTPPGSSLPTTERVGSRYVTFVSTQNNLYVFDPVRSPCLVPAVADTISNGGDAQMIGIATVPYFSTAPCGPIVAKYQSKFWYAGFQLGQRFTLTRPVVGQTANPLVNQLAVPGAQAIALSPSIVIWSDATDPVGVAATSCVALDAEEEVVAIAPFGQQLVIFSKRSIYVIAGSNTSNYQLLRVVHGIGCASRTSVVEVSGVLYFASWDGIYGWDGSGTPVKISVHNDAFWTGKYTHTPTTWNVPLNDYPYVATQVDLVNTHGVYDAANYRILWSYQVAQQPNATYAIAMVFDLTTKAWSQWLTKDPTSACLYAGAVVNTRMGTRLYTTTARGSLQCYGLGYMDGPDHTGNLRAVATVWQTPLIASTSDKWKSWRRVHLKMLGCGSTQTQMPVVVMTGESSWVVPGDEKMTQFKLHPYPDGPWFWDSSTWDGTIWVQNDFFTSIADVATPSETCRIMLADLNATDEQRPPLVVLESFTIEFGDQGFAR